MRTAPTILVVEDTDIARDPLVKLLRREGYESFGAANGQDAWDLLPTHEPDLILLDILMPVMNGLEFLGMIRTDPRWADLPVVVLTAVRDETWEQDIRALGVQGFVLKTGFGLDELLALIRIHLGPDD